jgi:hypothetical protein
MKCKQRVVCFYNEKINGKCFLLLYFLFFLFRILINSVDIVYY